MERHGTKRTRAASVIITTVQNVPMCFQEKILILFAFVVNKTLHTNHYWNSRNLYFIISIEMISEMVLLFVFSKFTFKNGSLSLSRFFPAFFRSENWPLVSGVRSSVAWVLGQAALVAPGVLLERGPWANSSLSQKPCGCSVGSYLLVTADNFRNFAKCLQVVWAAK